MTDPEKIAPGGFYTQDPADFVELVDAEVAHGLHAIDRGCMVARNLLENKNAIPKQHLQRALESAERALKIRAAIEGAGIRLPALRDIQDPEEEPIPVDRETWTVSEIARMAGVHRNTISRRLQATEGPLGERWREARRTGRRAVFNLAEVEEILGTGERCRDE